MSSRGVGGDEERKECSASSRLSACSEIPTRRTRRSNAARETFVRFASRGAAVGARARGGNARGTRARVEDALGMDAHDGISIFGVWPSNVPLRGGGRGGRRGDHRQSAEPTACAKRARRRGALIAERRSGFGTARAARRPRARTSARFGPSGRPVFAGAGATAGIARATPPQPTRGGGAFLFRALDDEPRDAARRARARGHRSRSRDAACAEPRGAPTSRARVRRAQPRTAGACLPDGGRARREKHHRIHPATHTEKDDRGSSSTSDCASDLLVAIDPGRWLVRLHPVPRGTPEGRVRARFAAMATPVTGSTPAARRTDPSRDARERRGVPRRGPVRPGRAPPGAGAGAAVALRPRRHPRRRRPRPAPRPRPRSSARPRRRRTHPSAPRRVAARTPGLFGGGVGVGPRPRPRRGKDLRRGARLRAAAPPSAADEDEDDPPPPTRGPPPARGVDGGQPAVRIRAQQPTERLGIAEVRRPRDGMGAGPAAAAAAAAQRGEPTTEGERGGQHEGTPWANGRGGEKGGPVVDRRRRRQSVRRGRKTRGGRTRAVERGCADSTAVRWRAMRTVSPPPPPPPRPRGFRRARGLGEDELVWRPEATGKIVEFVIGPL